MDDALTPIEVEVLRLISQGCTYSLRQRGTPSMGR
jgi:DNA-binding CsgD family transcriptional regulator